MPDFKMNKKGDFTMTHIAAIMLTIALIIWVLIYYANLGERMSSILGGLFG